jgi:Fibroblast growth factor
MLLFSCLQPKGDSNRCVLKELVTDGFFTEFQSAVNADWFVGFNRRGQRLPGAQWKRNPNQRHCYQFVKMDKWNAGSEAITRSPALNFWKAVRKMPT